MGFKEEILMNIYRSITLSQYLYNAPLLGSASTQAKKEMEKQQHRFFNIIGITSARALEVYKIEPIATFLDHQCVNVVERILKDPTHPITQKQTVKSHHNTRSSQHIPATARTKTYQNSCLQKALRIKRDGYVNKYTNPRKAETTTPEYITVIQDLKQQAKKSLRSDYKTNSTKALTTESKTISNTKCTICNHQLNTAIGLKIHVTKMHKNINKTKN
jgi:hypothetical protein